MRGKLVAVVGVAPVLEDHAGVILEAEEGVVSRRSGLELERVSDLQVKSQREPASTRAMRRRDPPGASGPRGTARDEACRVRNFLEHACSRVPASVLAHRIIRVPG
jgi:hypothetical protein